MTRATVVVGMVDRESPKTTRATVVVGMVVRSQGPYDHTKPYDSSE